MVWAGTSVLGIRDKPAECDLTRGTKFNIPCRFHAQVWKHSRVGTPCRKYVFKNSLNSPDRWGHLSGSSSSPRTHNLREGRSSVMIAASRVLHSSRLAQQRYHRSCSYPLVVKANTGELGLEQSVSHGGGDSMNQGTLPRFALDEIGEGGRSRDALGG